MNNLLTIKAEAVAVKPASDNSQSPRAAGSNGFGQALEKQVQDNSRAEAGRANRSAKAADQPDNTDKAAAKTDEAAITAKQDGKKLPSDEEGDKTVKAENSEAAESPVAESTPAEPVVTSGESDQETDTETAETEDPQTEKPQVTVAVAAPAMQNAATDKVTMTLSETAKAQAKPVDSDPEVKPPLANLTPVINAQGDIASTEDTVRFADILKKEGLTTNSIRADILQAISQKTSAEDSDGQTLKTNLQNLLLNAENKPMNSAQVSELIRQIQPGQQHGSDHRAPASLITALTPAATTPAQAATGAAPQLALDIQPQLNNPAWSRVVSSRVVWMAREGVQQAELRLNPASLGSVELRLSINNDQASVTFLAQNAATRDALEQAMPRLRESLAENGLALSHSEVGQQNQSGEQASDDETSMQKGHLAQVSVTLDDTEDELAATIQPEVNEQSTGVSLYA